MRRRASRPRRGRHREEISFAEGMSFHWSATDPELERLTNEIDAIERRHGLSEDESFA